MVAKLVVVTVYVTVNGALLVLTLVGGSSGVNGALVGGASGVNGALVGGASGANRSGDRERARSTIVSSISAG